MLRSRSPRRALRHFLRGFRKDGSSQVASRDQAASLSRKINEISAKGLLALAVSWSLAEIALVFTAPAKLPEDQIVELPLPSPPLVEVADTSGELLRKPVTFWLGSER
jgi:hypothetical protein